MTQVIDIVVKGGIVMIPLLACSLISLTLTIERLFFWGRIKSQEAVQNMLGLVESGQFEQALKLGKNSQHPIARVLTAGRSGAPQSGAGKGDGSCGSGADSRSQKPPRRPGHNHHSSAAPGFARYGSRHDRII
jgi:hypothetical protein